MPTMPIVALRVPNRSMSRRARKSSAIAKSSIIISSVVVLPIPLHETSRPLAARDRPGVPSARAAGLVVMRHPVHADHVMPGIRITGPGATPGMVRADHRACSRLISECRLGAQRLAFVHLAAEEGA